MGVRWSERGFHRLVGVEPYEVEQVLAGRKLPKVEATSKSRTRMGWCGRTTKGRLIVVVVEQTDRWNWLIVGARPMDDEEREVFETWEAK